MMICMLIMISMKIGVMIERQGEHGVTLDGMHNGDDEDGMHNGDDEHDDKHDEKHNDEYDGKHDSNGACSCHCLVV